MGNGWLGITLYHNLGIIGSLLMLSGMIYSIKKRWNKLIGSTPFWNPPFWFQDFLNEGDTVEFAIEQSQKGPQAINVKKQ
jgi:hypothetical protein